MRVLILSANTGGGHNSAAKAIGEALRDRNIAYDTTDALAFMSNTVSTVISRGHVNLYRYLPGLFGVGYRFAENHSPKALYEGMALGAKKLAGFIRSGGYDAVVCTHVFAAMMMTEVGRKYDLTIPNYFVPTDYTCYPGTCTVEAEAIFLPAEGLRQEFLDGGVQEDKLLPMGGIPIAAAYRHPPDRGEARRRIGLPPEGRMVLLCCGSMGCGHIHRIAAEFVGQLPDDTTLVVICGHNMHTYKQLDELKLERMVPVGFTDRMVEYMAAADVCVTKPGGLSTTELLSVKVPMVLLLAVPGCESRNLDFLEREGLALRAESWEEAISTTARLLRESKTLAALQKRLQKTDYGDGAEMVSATIAKRNEQK